MRLIKLLTAFTLCCALFLSGSWVPALAAEEEDDLPPLEFDDIIDRGVLRVGVKTSVVGFSFQDPITGQYEGMENTLSELIAEKLGVKVEFIPVTAASRIDQLSNEEVDLVIATFSVTPERKKQVDFSTPYYVDNVSVLVNQNSHIKHLKDLEGTTVAVCTGTTSPGSLVSALIDQKIIAGKDFDPVKFDPASWKEGVQFKLYNDYPSAAAALEEQKVQAFCGDRSILSYYNNEKLRYIDAHFAPQEYAIACKKGRGLTPYLNELLVKWMQDGTLAKLLKDNNID